MRIHMLGPSGSGTSTLGKALSGKFGIPWFDADDFFWEPTEPPFTKIRPRDERVEFLRRMDDENESWILSGSMIGWGDFLRDRFDFVVYMYLGREERIRRLKEREKARFGDRIEYGHDMHEHHNAFIEWASRYEDGDMSMRSKQSETEWMKGVTCPILRIESSATLEEELELVSDFIMR